MERVKYFAALLGGAVMSYLGQYRFVYLMVAAAVLLDLISGMAAAVINGAGLSSKTAYRGLLKKLMLLFSVGFGTFLDVLLPWCGEMVGLHIESGLMFSAVISVYICIGESISILENIYKSTGRQLPEWIGNLLLVAKEKINKENGNE